MKAFLQRFINHRTFMLIMIMLGVAYFLSLRDGRFTDHTEYEVYEQARLKGDSRCDVAATACIKSNNDMRVTLALLDQPSALRSFPVRVEIESAQSLRTAKVKLLFTMADMQMGDLKQKLEWQEDGDEWVGQVILPICSTGRSDWRVQVEVILEKKIYLADYHFMLKK